MKSQINVFIFRRDLRVQDNLALKQLLEKYPKIPTALIFIFNDIQIEPRNNGYFSSNAFQFMIESLDDLNKQVKNKLNFLHTTSDDIKVLASIKNKYVINCIAFNKDYTPFARLRDAKIITWCKTNNIDVLTDDDYTLVPTTSMLTKTGGPYKVFTPFLNSLLKQNIQKPVMVSLKNVIKLNIKQFKPNVQLNKNILVTGGRQKALQILAKIKRGTYKNYSKTRNLPELQNGTTKLSAYMKFGCVSVREVFDAVVTKHNKKHALVSELVWREFYAHLAYNFPHVLKGHAFKRQYDKMKWKYNMKWWNAWICGCTGVPFVDAGMRQLNQTGWCHNRLRMVVAMFLTKDMLIDYRRGEKYFATQLVDYDPCSNNGGWSWCSGVGVDVSYPRVRIFNPYTQCEKYDPKCVYVKRWIPELKDVPIKHIHKWYKYHDQYNVYLGPILDHDVQRKKAIKMLSL